MDSNDSSSPFWHGYLGIGLDDSIWGLENGKSPIEVDFHAEYEMGRVGTIQMNIDYMESKILM